ncbi:hypothetical protein [Novacetimonas pomaceti]|uniref:RNA methyltransferase n=1 Tax=Novacetimonas pomaceti TaxID=2021998 RepID=A0A318QI07_9PROT|nr:hypothetical protein [Novacetimonas pomaceti]PYD74999.1 hypothetical protein CFR71_11470 [Novacetimonas pomaceti]
MATYQQVQDWIRARDGFAAKSCWIAHILSDHGKTRRQANNRIDPNQRKHPCPPEKRPVIEAALRHFKMI